jgi:hypothetical protein
MKGSRDGMLTVPPDEAPPRPPAAFAETRPSGGRAAGLAPRVRPLPVGRRRVPAARRRSDPAGSSAAVVHRCLVLAAYRSLTGGGNSPSRAASIIVRASCGSSMPISAKRFSTQRPIWRGSL